MIEQKSKIDKEVVQLKYNGNHKQFELNADLDSIIKSIETESERGEPNFPLINVFSRGQGAYSQTAKANKNCRPEQGRLASCGRV